MILLFVWFGCVCATSYTADQFRNLAVIRRSYTLVTSFLCLPAAQDFWPDFASLIVLLLLYRTVTYVTIISTHRLHTWCSTWGGELWVSVVVMERVQKSLFPSHAAYTDTHTVWYYIILFLKWFILYSRSVILNTLLRVEQSESLL